MLVNLIQPVKGHLLYLLTPSNVPLSFIIPLVRSCTRCKDVWGRSSNAVALTHVYFRHSFMLNVNLFSLLIFFPADQLLLVALDIFGSWWITFMSTGYLHCTLSCLLILFDVTEHNYSPLIDLSSKRGLLHADPASLWYRKLEKASSWRLKSGIIWQYAAVWNLFLYSDS